MVSRDGFTVIDATKDIEEQQMQVRRNVLQILPESIALEIGSEELKAAEFQ